MKKRSGEYNKALESKNYSDFNDYINIERWNSFYYQVKEILNLNPKSILEIGAGNNFLRNFFSDYSLTYKSVDVDEKLNPDYLVDIRKLNNEIKEKFDVVVAFQVLEHLPYKYFISNLKEMKKVSNRFIIISLPVNGISYDFRVKLSKFIDFHFVGKLPFLKAKIFHEHFWEINFKHKLKKIRKDILKEFKILKEYHCRENTYHYFFVLEKK